MQTRLILNALRSVLESNLKIIPLLPASIDVPMAHTLTTSLGTVPLGVIRDISQKILTTPVLNHVL